VPSPRNAEVTAKAFGSWLVDGDPVEKVRAGYDRMPPPLPEDVAVAEATAGGVPGLWFTPARAGEAVILYFHGGGFTIGSPRSHGELTARIAKAAGARLFSAQYSLAPERVFPAALDDAVAAYRGLLAEGVEPRRLAVVGDSAGGGIALAMMVALRDAGQTLPACAATLSAWADLTCSGRSYAANVDLDPLVTPEMGLQNAATYLGGHDPRDPLASPVFADLTGLPPLLLQVGTDELLLDDTLRLAERARAAGVEVELQVAEGMMHVYQLLTWLLPEALAAIDEIGAFVRRHAAGGPSPAAATLHD
jgi:monoterpene epsilon-lactone hydrolase